MFFGGGDILNILYCGDANVCEGIFLSTLSICKNTHEELNIYLLTASINTHTAISQHFAEQLQNAVSEKILMEKFFCLISAKSSVLIYLMQIWEHDLHLFVC